MSFVGVPFALVFLPLFFISYRLAGPALRLPLILFSSIVFLVSGQAAALPWLLGLGWLGYAFGRAIASRLAKGRKAALWLGLGIGLNAAILLAFKLLAAYPLQAPAWRAWGLDKVVLPLGLSYLTFQMIAYLVDVSSGVIPVERNFFRLAAYVLFFPKVASGPIMKFQDFARSIGSLRPSEKDAVSGLGRILAGGAKCVFLAQPLGRFVDAVFGRSPADVAPALAWLALPAGMLQIYFDFSGYTDIALGLGRMIGVNLPENFNFPFIAQSLGDFWRRWHMTLIGWFREYVFFPLERLRRKRPGQPINLMLVFFLTGVWHAPTLNFIIWGFLQGAAIVFETTAPGRWLRTCWRPVRHAYVLLVVLFSWIFFRSPSLPYAFGFIGRLFGQGTSPAPTVPGRAAGLPVPGPSFFLVLLLALVFTLPVKKAFLEFAARSGAALRWQRFSGQSPAGRALRGGAAVVWAHKAWWLIPMASVLAIFGILFVLFETSAPARFIYAGF